MLEAEIVLSFKKPDRSFEGFSDADWGSDADTRRSNTGYVFQYASGSVSWSCKKQTTVALSTMEAEYMALSAATQEAVCWRGLRGELLGIQDAVPIFCDNRMPSRKGNWLFSSHKTHRHAASFCKRKAERWYNKSSARRIGFAKG